MHSSMNKFYWFKLVVVIKEYKRNDVWVHIMNNYVNYFRNIMCGWHILEACLAGETCIKLQIVFGNSNSK